MTDKRPPFDETRAHRWFAVEANNLAWDLLKRADRSEAETQRMIHAAHAAAFHWSSVGAPINALRAEVLLATAYHGAGRADAAMIHADRGLAMMPSVGAAATAFDRASICAAGAGILPSVGRHAEAAALLSTARATANELDNPEDRRVLERFYPILNSTDSTNVTRTADRSSAFPKEPS